MRVGVFFFFFGCISAFFALGCGENSSMPDEMEPADCVENLSFSSDIQQLISTNCAYSGCHVAGTGLPRLTSYQDVKIQIENGKFEDRVLVRQNMPPNNASGPTELSNEELFLLQCWLDQGYAE